MLRAGGLEVVVRETSYAGHARDLAREMELGPGAALCALGGDGTIHEVVNGIMERPVGCRPPLAVLPAGSGNALMHDLAALDPHEAARRILAGRRRSLDIARISHPGGILHAFNMIGWGLVADIGVRSERLRWLGARRYTVASVVEVLAHSPRRARLELPGEVFEGDIRFVFAGNTRHTGAGMRLTPEARIDDGLLDLIMVRGGTRGALLRLFAGLGRGGHLDSPLVTFRRVPRFHLEAEADGPLNVDGELTASAPFEVEVLHRALELLV
jgi:diacylglycerol kinase (ATP)